MNVWQTKSSSSMQKVWAKITGGSMINNAFVSIGTEMHKLCFGVILNFISNVLLPQLYQNASGGKVNS